MSKEKFLNSAEKGVLQQFVRFITSLCPGNIDRITVFGSKIRGESRPDSDVDILILVDDKGLFRRDRAYDFILNANLEHGMLISLKLYEKRDFDRLLTAKVPFALNVAREGAVLWAR
ncbi:MAG: nucleotidyltransferase domain-containing protein [Peptococcaceae bacterium]|jgi:predicted nucleotidyltransferase|nr:nucleotidyltransferase domain-containing protein [Peptococcaceae bacterium]